MHPNPVNQVLREKLGRRRILLSDEQRCRLAVRATVLGRKDLAEVGTLVTPDTVLRWHRLLVAQKWDFSQRRAKQYKDWNAGGNRLRNAMERLIFVNNDVKKGR